MDVAVRAVDVASRWRARARVAKLTCELRAVTVTPGACTDTVVVPVLVASAFARAVIVTVPGCDGAVKRPLALMLPPLLVHVTRLVRRVVHGRR